MKIKGPFVKLIMFDQKPVQLLRSFVHIKTQKSKDPMVQFRFLNIHITHKAQLAMINMPLKGHRIGIYI
jgi:hypothetical protein